MDTAVMFIVFVITLCIDLSGEVYICGSVENAPFEVNSSNKFFEKLEKIDKERPFGKRAVDIACGREYIIVVAEDGNFILSVYPCIVLSKTNWE